MNLNRIDRKFSQLKRQNKKAFIVFITAGYPNLGITRRLIFEFAKRGVDIIELGVPFSDPLADGPIIQEASQVALENKVNLKDILHLVKEVRRDNIDTPICLMTYYNPIFCFGEKKFSQMAYACGVDGVIIPDLPPEEGGSFIKLAHKYKLDHICFISPTTSDERMKYLASISQGFIYYISLTGVTGPRQRLAFDLMRQLKAIKKITRKPVCAGFGISHPKQIKQIYKIADGVIVGSAIVKKIKENLPKKNLVESVGRFIAYLKHV